jgi:Holliday junction resolvase RusA-like endonuclease
MPPSVNNAFFNLPGGGRARSREYEGWLKAAGWSIRLAKIPMIPGRVAVQIRAAMPKRSRDLDNLSKLILDALVRFAVIQDDRHVMRLSLEWAADLTENTVETRVAQASSPEVRHRIAQGLQAASSALATAPGG